MTELAKMSLVKGYLRVELQNLKVLSKYTFKKLN